MLRLKSLETIILAPVVAFLLLAGTGLYFLISKSVDDFANRSIQENLSSLSRAAYEEADREMDRCDAKGLDCLGGAQKTNHQIAVYERFDDFARQNAVGVAVVELDHSKLSFQSGIPMVPDIFHHMGTARDAIIRGPGGETFYARTIEFSPWNWQIVLLKNSQDFAALKESVRVFYMGTGFAVLLIAGSLIVYLRRAIAQPINHMVSRLQSEHAPEYRGIREFEFLSDNIGQIMGDVHRHQHHMEELVEARTVELEEARSRLTDALESISEGFAFYDAADRLVLCNGRYREIMFSPGTGEFLQAGASFETLIRAAAERGLIPDAEGRIEEWIAERLESHRNPGPPCTQQRANGNWVQISERRTQSGGTVGVYTDITHIKRAVQAKSQFLHGISHNFGNKLHQIRGFTDIVLDRNKDLLPREHRENLEKALQSTRNLQLMIKELLAIATTDEGIMSLEPEELTLGSVVYQCVQAHENEGKIRGGDIRIVKVLAQDQPKLFTDGGKLRQIVDNLVGNAIKFTEAGKITVSTRSANDTVSVEVADTGIGISENELGSVFDEFHQVMNRAGKPAGTGLGLAISQKYARMLGGDIAVHSTVGVGSTFILTIPVRCPGASRRIEPLIADG